MRADDIQDLRISSSKAYYVLDSHTNSYNSYNGNCNGALDVGEQVLLFVNLENLGVSDLGSFSAVLTDGASTLDIYPEPGFYGRVFSGSSFVQSLPTNGYKFALQYEAAFQIYARPGSAGVHPMQLKVTNFQPIENRSVSRTFNFDLDVGSSPNLSSCTPAPGVILWP